MFVHRRPFVWYSWRDVLSWIEQPAVKWVLPVPLLAALIPLIWRVFRHTWREMEDDALAYRQTMHERGEVDYRPVLAFVLAAFVLTGQEYYGQFTFWQSTLRGWVLRPLSGHADALALAATYNELFGRAWWGVTRIGGYLLPLAIWPLFFRQDSLLDMGLRARGFRQHAWLYALFVAVMVPVMMIVAKQPDFGAYYPFYAKAGRSWIDFILWETVYIAQFLGLEVFFRGWWLRANRAFGLGAIFSMVVPYCMIHYGKPYLEADAAIIAGIVLGSLSMKTRSIWAGFMVHGTVALFMDILALQHKRALPTRLSAASTSAFVFPYWNEVLWAVWASALLVLAATAWHRRVQLRDALPRLPWTPGR